LSFFPALGFLELSRVEMIIQAVWAWSKVARYVSWKYRSIFQQPQIWATFVSAYLMALDSRIKLLKRTFLWQCIYFSCYLLCNFINLSQCLVWKCFKPVYKRTLCEHIVYSTMLSISKLTYLKWKTITAVFNMNGGVLLNSEKMTLLQ